VQPHRCLGSLRSLRGKLRRTAPKSKDAECRTPQNHDVKSISPDELDRRCKSGGAPFILDVREPEEMVDGVIPGSINIPMEEVERRLSEIPTDRDVVVICHIGARSGFIARKLNALGYDRAMNLTGGMEAWLTKPRTATG
jgi:rhodanese-related sulfurtransferase